MKDLFANLFEFWGSFASISADDLYDLAYTQLGLMLVGITFLVVLGYYRIFDSPRFHRWWHWLIVLASTSIAMFFIAWMYVAGRFVKEGLFYQIFDYLEFLIAIVIYSAIIFAIFSILVKRFSINRRKTPF
jgi:hypothetical protein